ncbi:MAG: RNA 2',3'-cyclic phosphodiesterase, partial [Nitrospiraceae bacterium]
MIRAFVAIELNPNLRSALAQIQTSLKSAIPRHLPPGARIQWVRPDSIHLTLKFLGDTDETRLGEIERALALAAHSQTRFSLDVCALGVFPDLRAPRVLWVGLSGQEDQDHAHTSDRLVRLAGDIDQAMATLGYPTESRPFNPHLTLARIKEHAREVGRA